jgi:uncharacterized protein DUF4397
MRYRRCAAAFAAALPVIGLLTSLLTGLLTGNASAAPPQGQIRLAHLSPDAPAVDVYLYAAGSRSPELVLRHVGYGALSPYQRLTTGAYRVAMRPEDAPASSKPLLTTRVIVRGGAAYTVAGMGPFKSLKLKVINDRTRAPGGRSQLRVIAASLREPSLNVTAGGRTISTGLQFAAISGYRRLPARTTKVAVRGRNSSTTTSVQLTAGTVHTLVVLDSAAGLKLLTLRDATTPVAPVAPPHGGVDTGLGGAQRPPEEPKGNERPIWPYVAIGAFLLVVIAGARQKLRRT